MCCWHPELREGKRAAATSKFSPNNQVASKHKNVTRTFVTPTHRNFDHSGMFLFSSTEQAAASFPTLCMRSRSRYPRTISPPFSLSPRALFPPASLWFWIELTNNRANNIPSRVLWKAEKLLPPEGTSFIKSFFLREVSSIFFRLIKGFFLCHSSNSDLIWEFSFREEVFDLGSKSVTARRLTDCPCRWSPTSSNPGRSPSPRSPGPS